MSEKRLAWLRDFRDETKRRKETLEAFCRAYDTLEAPDPHALVDDRSSNQLTNAIYDLAKTTQFHTENDIEVMETGIATLDKVIELVEQGKDEEAKALFQALSDLGKQFTKWPEPPTSGAGSGGRQS